MEGFPWHKIAALAYKGEILRDMIRSYRGGMGEESFLKRYLTRYAEGSPPNGFQKEWRADDGILNIYMKEYPHSLRRIHLPPIVLFWKGNLGLLQGRMGAVVGSRWAPAAALERADRIGRRMEKAGLIGVSGLARGIDGSMHRACSPSIGVIGCGLDQVYPRENRSLYEKLEIEGLILAEFLPGVPPLPFHFPRRNRIIAALGEWTAVIWGKPGSGAFITADYALEEGKDLFVPEELLEAGILPGYPLALLEKHLDTGEAL